uniref:Serpentine receptor class gamma n=1 Tax=Steinernema glaseri TaxID=37863 RepID=A0A1I7ZRN3_9BILA
MMITSLFEKNMVVIFLASGTPIPLLYVLSLVDTKIQFSYHAATYRYTGPAYFESPFIYIRMVLEGTALGLYFLTVVVIVCQQSVYHMAPLKFSRREIRLLAQALLQSLPVAFTMFIGAFLFQEIWKHGLLFIVWSVTSITIPATHLLILILFNSNVRRHLRKLVRRAPGSKLFVTTPQRTGSTRSGGRVEMTRIMRSQHH